MDRTRLQGEVWRPLAHVNRSCCSLTIELSKHHHIHTRFVRALRNFESVRTGSLGTTNLLQCSHRAFIDRWLINSVTRPPSRKTHEYKKLHTFNQSITDSFEMQHANTTHSTYQTGGCGALRGLRFVGRAAIDVATCTRPCTDAPSFPSLVRPHRGIVQQ
jgi:hypothetical protein